ncbi:hypothetical protein [Ovoidimarina sediminis]|nr:hypothetical protein [Rhodophyticola sp. MJ-SS7]MDU8945961.1 hypothetical protein [Rhodophyticola sp. MJ-SS7]
MTLKFKTTDRTNDIIEARFRRLAEELQTECRPVVQLFAKRSKPLSALAA